MWIPYILRYPICWIAAGVMMSVRAFRVIEPVPFLIQHAIVNWVRYNQVMSAIGEILNSALRAILSLFNDTPSHVTIEIPEDVPQPGVTGRGKCLSEFHDLTILI